MSRENERRRKGRAPINYKLASSKLQRPQREVRCARRKVRVDERSMGTTDGSEGGLMFPRWKRNKNRQS